MRSCTRAHGFVCNRYTCTEIAHELYISHGSAHSILTERLKIRNVAARWVPHMLSDSKKHHRVKIARSLLHRYGEEGDEMLQRIVAIDETWMRSFEPELKQQSSEWHTKDSPRPLNFRRSQNCPKMLMIFANDFRGVLTAHRVPTSRTVNKNIMKSIYGQYFVQHYAASAQNLKTARR